MSAQYWNQLLDDLKAKDGFRSDAKMAASLEVSRALVSAVRVGRSNFSLDVGKKIFVRLGRIMTIYDLHYFEPRNIQVARKEVASKDAMEVSPKRRARVILRAKGRCQLCGCEAPFVGSDGVPFLEIHHIKPIASGGTHHRDNLAAVCPNCHRRIHDLKNPADLLKLEQIADAIRVYNLDVKRMRMRMKMR